ncbi:MAG: cytochrome P450 [Halieaceae bacterium]|nr:cytochrome P450 [Halieaceae bacterium]
MKEIHYLERPDNRDLRQIPGDYGLPLIGNVLSLTANPLKFCDEHFHRYGAISRFAMGPSHMVLALGPENARELHLDVGKNFSSAKGLGHFESLIGGSLIMKDFEEHRFQRRLMQTAFKKSSMDSYVENINAISTNTLHPLYGAGEFQLQGHARSTLLEIAAQTFTGVTGQGREGTRLKTAFEEFIDGFNFIFEVNLPGFKYRRSLRAKKYIAAFIGELIADKRHNNDKDILAYFCRERDEGGEYYSDCDIVENFVVLLFAAQDTTTASLVNACYELGRHPQWQQRMREEARALGKDSIEQEDLDALPSFDMVFNETQRLHSSVPLFPRRSINPCELSGMEIPADTLLMNAITYNHVMPGWWKEPQRFDPERFGRGEHKQHPFLFHPFGGGAHKCIGMHFAKIVFCSFMYHLITGHEIKLRPGYDPDWHYLPMPKPKDNLPMRLAPVN